MTRLQWATLIANKIQSRPYFAWSYKHPLWASKAPHWWLLRLLGGI